MSEVSSEESSAPKSASNEMNAERQTTDEAHNEMNRISSDESNQQSKVSARGANSSKNNVDLVLISDDEGEERNECSSTPERLNGQSSPNGVESVDSDDSDGIGLVEEYSEGSDGSDGNDDEIEITGVSMANSELGTVGGMDQLLRTLIDQGWTENEIMQQLRTMLGPYHRRPRLNVFNSLDDVVQCIKRVNKIIVVSGAGISVSCGIPDFRSETGLYARLSKDYPTLPNPTAMFDLHYFLNDPKPFYTFAKELWPGQFKPSPCHRFIKLMEAQGKLLRNYTQNIDTLEQVAGIENVIQCHGSFATASCIYCRYQVSGDVIKNDIMESRAPLCPKCEEKRLLDGPEAFTEFARTHYRDIKKKLRRREKMLCSSSDSDSSDSSFTDSPEADGARQKKSPVRSAAEAESSSRPASTETPSQGTPGKTSSQDVPDETPSQGEPDEAPSCSSPQRRPEAASGDEKPEEKKSAEDNEAAGAAASSNDTRESAKMNTIAAILEESSTVTSTTNVERKAANADEPQSSSRNSLEGLLLGGPQPSSSRGTDGPGPSRVSPLRRPHATPKPKKPKREPLDPLLKPDIVFFGEDLPRTFFEHAEEDLDQAELIIVIGSSMKVKPVASIPEFVRESTPRVLINREPVKHISFDAELLGDADEIVQQLCHRLEWDSPVDAARSDLNRPVRPRVVPLDELSPLPSREEVERIKAGAKAASKPAVDGDEAEKDAEGQPGSSGNGEEASSEDRKVQESRKDDEDRKDENRKDEKGREDKENLKDEGRKEEEDRKDEDRKDEEKGPARSERHEFEEPCPLFGSRCRCPLNWNIANFLPEDAVVKMMPATFIFPGAIMNHPKHVFTALSVADESMNVDSDSDLGGMENPIEVSSSEDGGSSDGEVEELLDMGSGNNSVCLLNDGAGKTAGRPPSESDNTDEKQSSEASMEASNSPVANRDCHQDSAPSQKRPSSSVNDDADEPNGKTPRLSEEEKSEDTKEDESKEKEKEIVTEHGDSTDA